MRLIDADALPRQTQIYEFNGKRMENEIVNAKSIDNAPTIDAEPVVRCRDCKRSDWYTGANGKHLYYCMEHGSIGHNENDYCSYGERRDDE